MDQNVTLPRTGLSLDDARRKLSGWHFAKEALSEGEREILYVAEGLLRLIDQPDEDARKLRALIAKPGVVGVDLHADGIEVCGSARDSDDSAGFVPGSFTMRDVHALIGNDLPITDCR